MQIFARNEDPGIDARGLQKTLPQGLSAKGLFLSIALAFFPFFTGYGYLYLHVQKSIRERRIQQTLMRQEDLRRRNAALKKELSRYSIDGILGKSTSALEFVEHSRIIHLELPPVPASSEKRP